MHYHSETALQLSSSLLIHCHLNFSNRISIVGSCDGAFVLKIVSTVPSTFQNIVAITLWANTTTRNFLGSGEEACFQAVLCTLLTGSKRWSQDSCAVINRKTKLPGFSLNRWSRLVDGSIWFAFWTPDDVRGTRRADIFINKFSVKMECILPVEMPADAVVKNWPLSITRDKFVDFFNTFFDDRSC